jgi:hypothetical protein
MTKRFLYTAIFCVSIFICVGIVAYSYRFQIRTTVEAIQKPALPTPSKFSQGLLKDKAISDVPISPVEGGVATSQHYILVSSPTTMPAKIDPFLEKDTLPATINLAVPFISQAPTGNWSLPYQETCEEASAIMVDAFYQGKDVFSVKQAMDAIDTLVDFENKLLGEYKDTSAEDTAKFIKGYFGYTEVLVVPYDTLKLKRAVANGFPVIVPASGKKLPNPNFRNGGPLYHMVVVKGYINDSFITNDTGTSRGADFIYTTTALKNAAHDWNGGDVINGVPVMIVIVPKGQ